MSPPTRKAAIAATLVAGAAGHGIMTIPVARPDTSDPRGTKFTPFSDARNLANRGCGEADKGGLNTVQQPIQVYQRGAAIQVQWEHTIPHPADNRDTGVRIALHYGPGDSFECNILAGGLEGDPGFGGTPNRKLLSAGPPDVTPNQRVGTLVTLPNNKTCDYCVLQWVWAARSDNGFYMSCADIAITPLGTPVDYALKPSEAGNELPENQPRQGGGCSSSSGEASGGAVAVIVICLLFVAAAGLGYMYCKNKKASPPAKPASAYAAAPPPPPSSGGGGGGALPPGWTSAVDPTSRQTYYTNTATGASQWTPPSADAAPPPPPPAAPPRGTGGGMPPGWTQHFDQVEQRTYYIGPNGQPSWEPPLGAVVVGYA